MFSIVDKKIRIHNISGILLVMILFLTSSYPVYRDAISTAMTIGLWLLLLVFLLLKNKTLAKQHFFVFFVFITIFVISSVYNNENFKQLMAYFLSFTCAYLYTEAFGYKQFTETFVSVMRFLCIISLICLFLYSTVPGLTNLFTITTSSGKSVPSILIYTHSSTKVRNGGMFWEPGAFQTFILLALLFEVLENRIRSFDFVLFMVSIVSTFSTTGYIGAIYIVLIIYMKKNISNKKIKKIILVGAVALVVFFSINPDILFTGENSVFGKISYFFKERAYETYGVNQTSVVRYYAIIKPIEAFWESPFLGKGITGLKEYTYEYTLGMNTCTFVNYFATFGILYGVLAMLGYIGLVRKYTNDVGFGILLFLFYFLITFSENYLYNGFFFLLTMYGFHKNGNTITKNESFMLRSNIM